MHYSICPRYVTSRLPSIKPGGLKIWPPNKYSSHLHYGGDRRHSGITGGGNPVIGRLHCNLHYLQRYLWVKLIKATDFYTCHCFFIWCSYPTPITLFFQLVEYSSCPLPRTLWTKCYKPLMWNRVWSSQQWVSNLTQYMLLWMRSLKIRFSISLCNRFTLVHSHQKLPIYDN